MSTTPRHIVYIITGLSGAGKSYASHALEDAGFYCVDNLPPDLIKQFVVLAIGSTSNRQRLALVCDVRGGSRFNDLFHALEDLERQGIAHRIVFLEADDDVLVRRFSETRRKHPLNSGSLIGDITHERNLLDDVRSKADVIIDTSAYSVSRLKEHMLSIVGDTTNEELMTVTLLSFGFKYGLPRHSDLVFDVRFLSNPHYVADLAPLTGQDEQVQRFVLDHETSQAFLDQLVQFVDFLMPHFIKEGKSHLTIAFGCTGGRHRSVTFAEIMSRHLRRGGFRVLVEHRDSKR